MPTRKQILKSNFDASRIDYVGAFIRLWVSFNTWYNDQSNYRSEQQRVIAASEPRVVADRYWTEIKRLNDPAHNDNFKHIVDTIVDASTVQYSDANGNPVTMKTDSTGFRYRLRCNRTNAHTDFLRACMTDPILKNWCHGIVQFNTETRKDELFKVIYFGYKQYMVDHMYLPYDAFTDIPKALVSMGIQQYGCTLFHRLSKSHSDSSNIAVIKNIFGSGFVSLRTRALRYSSRTKVKKAYPRAGVTGKLYRWHESIGLNILERELLLLYKLRSSIVHGDRDSTLDEVQKIARHAYNALDDFMAPLFA